MFTVKEHVRNKAAPPPASRHHGGGPPATSRIGSAEFMQRHLGNRHFQEASGQRGQACSCGGNCRDCQRAGGDPEESGMLPPAVSRRHEAAGLLNGDQQEERTGTSGTTSGSRIDITFDPTTTSPKPQCDEIVFVQLIKMTADGSAILPGAYYTPWRCRNAAALIDGSYIDHDCECNTPYYTFCFNGTPGISNGTTANATMVDAPSTGGGDKGFKSSANPTGWKQVVYQFETHAFCSAGTDCPTWYDGIRWNYTKTAADQAAGRAGTSTGTASLLPPTPGSTIVTAFDHFNSVKNFTPCTMSAGRTGP